MVKKGTENLLHFVTRLLRVAIEMSLGFCSLSACGPVSNHLPLSGFFLVYRNNDKLLHKISYMPETWVDCFHFPLTLFATFLTLNFIVQSHHVLAPIPYLYTKLRNPAPLSWSSFQAMMLMASSQLVDYSYPSDDAYDVDFLWEVTGRGETISDLHSFHNIKWHFLLLKIALGQFSAERIFPSINHHTDDDTLLAFN